jgi:F-type H+-transporting ATPase subunit b
MFEDPAFWALVALIIFVALVLYLRVPRQIAGLLDRRVDAIRNELDEARRLREEAHALLADYQRKAREAESEAEEIVDQARREAEAIGVEAKQRMADYVAGRTRLAEDKITQAEAQALQEVRAQSADLAVAAAERILARRVKGEAADTLIGRAIDEVRTKLH